MASSSRSTSRPLSSSNLSTSIANARFKSFQVQFDILSRNAILAAIAQEIPWKNLFDLFLLKFFAVGDELWAQGEQPHELVFILCGGFLARSMDESLPEPPAASASDQNSGTQVLAEKLVKPGYSLAAYSVLRGTPLPYTVVAAKFKSILLALPTGRLKSVMRQLTPSTRELVQELIQEAEQKLMTALKLPFRVRTGPRSSTALASTQRERGKLRSKDRSTAKKHMSASLYDYLLGSSESQETGTAMKRSASASGFASVDGASSWASLHVAKPVEYEVNSSLLILHQSSSTSKLHIPSSSASKSARQSSNISTITSQIAKKHTQRRLESIKLPTASEAFPPRHLCLQQCVADKDGQLCNLEMVAKLLEQHLTKRVVPDVVAKERVGRLLKPLKKPAMLFDDVQNPAKSAEKIGTSLQYTKGRRVLVADRSEPFRDASQSTFAN